MIKAQVYKTDSAPITKFQKLTYLKKIVGPKGRSLTDGLTKELNKVKTEFRGARQAGQRTHARNNLSADDSRFKPNENKQTRKFFLW